MITYYHHHFTWCLLHVYTRINCWSLRARLGGRYYYRFHFTDRESETESLSDMAKVIMLSQFQTQASWPPSLILNHPMPPYIALPITTHLYICRMLIPHNELFPLQRSSIVLLSFTDGNTKACPWHRVSELKPKFSGSKLSFLSLHHHCP